MYKIKKSRIETRRRTLGEKRLDETAPSVPVFGGVLRTVFLFEDSRFDVISEHVDDSARKRLLNREGVF